MPERILRDYTGSAKFDDFPCTPEGLWVRLLTKVDDYGRFDGDPKNVRGECYKRADGLRADTVDACLNQLRDHQLILRYQVAGKPYLAIINFRQRLRLTNGQPPKPKFPPPEGKPLDFRPDDGDWRTLLDVSGDPPRPAASGGSIPPYAVADTNAKPVASANGDGGNYSLNSKPVLGDCKGGAEVSSARCQVPGGQFTGGVLRAIAVRICNNVDGWHYDNCKLQRNGFTLTGIETVLRPFLNRITCAQALAAWLEAVRLTHGAVVDNLPMAGTPEGYCTGVFKNLLEEAAKQKPVNEQLAAK